MPKTFDNFYLILMVRIINEIFENLILISLSNILSFYEMLLVRNFNGSVSLHLTRILMKHLKFY